MGIVHTKLADVYLYVAQIVPEYQPNDVVMSEDKGQQIPVFVIIFIVCAAVIVLLSMRMRRRRRKKNHSEDR